MAELVSAGEYSTNTFLCGLGFFLSLVLFGTSAYLAWCAFSMSYALNSENFTLRCGGVRQIIPLSSITDVYEPGAKVNDKAITVRWRGLIDIIPGYLVGPGVSKQIGRVVAVATRPVAQQVIVATTGDAYAISPTNPTQFIEQLNEKREKAANMDATPGEPRTELRGISAWAAPLWGDRLARILLLAGLLLCVLLFGYMSLVFNSLPTNLPLHWNSQAQVDVIGDPQELLRLPVFALVIWLVNAIAAAWVLRRERAATLFLLGGALAVQIVFAAGALSIVLRAT